MANGKFLLGQVVTTPGALKVLVRTGALDNAVDELTRVRDAVANIT